MTKLHLGGVASVAGSCRCHGGGLVSGQVRVRALQDRLGATAAIMIQRNTFMAQTLQRLSCERWRTLHSCFVTGNYLRLHMR